MSNVISTDKIVLNADIKDKQAAITLAGQLLVQGGHVTKDYIEKMFAREAMLTTYMGNGVAIPHGTNEAKACIKSSGISIIQAPQGVDFGDGNIAYLIFGIAGSNGEHLELLSNIAVLVSEEENVQKIVNAANKEEIMAMFEGGI